MTKQILHVARNAIASNARHHTNEPAIIVRKGSKATRHHAVDLIVGGEVVGRFVYSPDKPLACGARIWLEADSNLLELRAAA